MTNRLIFKHAQGVNGEALPFSNSYLPKNKSLLALRDYQEECIAKLNEKHKSGKRRVILCLPTGAGKTVTFSEISRRALEVMNRGRVLILTDRIELLHQAASTLGKAGIQTGILSAGMKHIPRQR
ncbi:DEAD/DEAH box helicase family protein, partial [Cytophagaceae bacterium DM2B3-1]